MVTSRPGNATSRAPLIDRSLLGLRKSVRPPATDWPAGRKTIKTVARVHRDESGAISILSVFAVIILVFLLGMVLNSGKQVDQKVKMQNAADAATYSGAVAASRGMNTLAFTNHLLCDLFALTAYMREARDRDAEFLTREILDNWARIGPAFEKAGLPDYGGYDKFGRLGEAITDKVPHEREVVLRFGNWAAAASEIMLPVFETTLAERQIPEFQRALVETVPELAQMAADRVARRHGRAWPGDVELRSVLWKTDGSQLFTGGLDGERWLPVVHPVFDEFPGSELYVGDAVEQRFRLAHRYLRRWNNESLPLFDGYAKMSQFSNLWRVFSGGHLRRLLDVEYPGSNLPSQILTRRGQIDDLNHHLERRYMLVGVVYREKMEDEMPGIFRNPIQADTQAYAQATVFVPKRRLIKVRLGPGGLLQPGEPPTHTGIPGQGLPVERPPSHGTPPPMPPAPEPPPAEDGETDEPQYAVARQNVHYHPENWSLVNQNWTAQLAPATCANLPQILSTQPYGLDVGSFDTPDLSGIREDDFMWLSNH